MTFSFRVVLDEASAKKSNEALKKVGRDAPKIVAQAAYNDLEDTMTISKQQAPVDTGVMRASGTVDRPVVEGDNWSVEIGYGGASAAYAIYVHENLSARHTVGNAKYLEKPLTERNGGMANRMGNAISKAYGV